ncbi:MAG: LemA family protein [Mycoplasmatota bacterium]
MEVLTIIFLSIILVCLFFIWFLSTFNRFQELIIRMNEAESNIDATLRKRFDLLNKAASIIRTSLKKEDVLNIIENIRSKKLSNFDLDRQLYEAINEFESLKLDHKELKKIEEFKKTDLLLQETESEIVAFRKYYNDIITIYNKMVKSFPTLLVALSYHYKSKLYYDGKDMSDDDIEDMKV